VIEEHAKQHDEAPDHRTQRRQRHQADRPLAHEGAERQNRLQLVFIGMRDHEARQAEEEIDPQVG
jgi:hypothetical protein